MKRARIHRFADGGTSVQANPSSAATADLTKLTVGTTTYGVPTVEANPSDAATTDLTKLEVGGTVYGVPTVEANPSSAATADLSKLTVGTTTFAIPTVEANPSDAATTELTKLEVGGVVYSLASTLDVTYGGTSPLTLDFASHDHPNFTDEPAGVFFFAGGMQAKTNWTRYSFSSRPLNHLFDGGLTVSESFQAITDTAQEPPSSGGTYSTGHFPWIDIQFDRPTRITNIKMYTMNGYANHFPRQFKWQAHRGNQPNASQMTVDGAYIQPNSSDESQWTDITSTFSGTITNSGSDTVSGATATYDQSVTNTTYWDRIRLRFIQGSSNYGADYSIGEIQIDGKRLL